MYLITSTGHPVLLQVPSDYQVPLKKDFFDHNGIYASCDSFINTRQIVKRLTLPPGVYVVVPCTWERDLETSFYIRFFFEKGNISE